MDHTEKMDKAAKRNMGIISFLPLAAYVAWAIHFFYLVSIYYPSPIFADKISAALADNFQSTLVFFILCFVLTSAVLVYFVVHVARTKLLNDVSKLGWILFMTFAAPIAFPVFWYNEIRNEPEELPIHPDIA
ncbi:MAG TPA: hypothetical protein VEB40_11075 [Flavipsychrobacter sp.]|nr:hypothetical protein [Flavipsychrobacter sp.]